MSFGVQFLTQYAAKIILIFIRNFGEKIKFSDSKFIGFCLMAAVQKVYKESIDLVCIKSTSIFLHVGKYKRRDSPEFDKRSDERNQNGRKLGAFSRRLMK